MSQLALSAGGWVLAGVGGRVAELVLVLDHVERFEVVNWGFDLHVHHVPSLLHAFALLFRRTRHASVVRQKQRTDLPGLGASPDLGISGSDLTGPAVCPELGMALDI